MAEPFPCFLVTKNSSGEVTASVAEKTIDDLPEGDTLIRVAFSSLNYKDALAASGHPGVVRTFPHVPGIDAAGTVEHSADPRLRPGDEVLVTGYELGAGVWGGYAQFVRVPADWVVPLPEGLTLRQSMALGTAGFTAAQSVDALRHHGVTPDSGEVLVTGATGGVGSLAVAMLAKLGYRVVAVTGKHSAHAELKNLGAAEILERGDVCDASEQPLLKSRWVGAVDTVGGATLATIIRSTALQGCIAACGLVGGVDLPLTVYPFILRGVTLAGIDSAHCPMPKRIELWRRLASEWKPADLDKMSKAITFRELPEHVRAMLEGHGHGRVVVEPKT